MSESLGFPVRQEEDVLATARLARIGLVSIFVAVVGVFVAGLITVVVAGALKPTTAGPGGPRPGPAEIAKISQTPIWDAQQGIDLANRQRADLGKFGWADRKAGIARIPIEDAIDLVVEESK